MAAGRGGGACAGELRGGLPRDWRRLRRGCGCRRLRRGRLRWGRLRRSELRGLRRRIGKPPSRRRCGRFCLRFAMSCGTGSRIGGDGVGGLFDFCLCNSGNWRLPHRESQREHQPRQQKRDAARENHRLKRAAARFRQRFFGGCRRFAGYGDRCLALRANDRRPRLAGRNRQLLVARRAVEHDGHANLRTGDQAKPLSRRYPGGEAAAMA